MLDTWTGSLMHLISCQIMNIAMFLLFVSTKLCEGHILQFAAPGTYSPFCETIQIGGD